MPGRATSETSVVRARARDVRWDETDPAARARQTTHRLKNLAILGGLLELALD
jgi:hypothetical protein